MRMMRIHPSLSYRPTPKEDIHEKSLMPRKAATVQNIASGIDAIGRKKDSLNEDIRSNDSKIASIGEEIAMDNEQIASMKENRRSRRSRMNRKTGGYPIGGMDMRGIRELIRNWRSGAFALHPYGRTVQGSAVRMPDKGRNWPYGCSVGQGPECDFPSRSSFEAGVSGIEMVSRRRTGDTGSICDH